MAGTCIFSNKLTGSRSEELVPASRMPALKQAVSPSAARFKPNFLVIRFQRVRTRLIRASGIFLQPRNLIPRPCSYAHPSQSAAEWPKSYAQPRQRERQRKEKRRGIPRSATRPKRQGAAAAGVDRYLISQAEHVASGIPRGAFRASPPPSPVVNRVTVAYLSV